MRKKIIITAALCGAGTSKDQTPYVPITPEEIARDAVECVMAGASIIHLHARDQDGKNTMETSRFIELVETVKSALGKSRLDAVLNLTSSGSSWPEEMRLAHLPILKSEMCSYDPGSMNWANSYVFLNTPIFLEKLGRLTKELNIKPEIEIFDAGMIGNVDYYINKGVLTPPCHYQFVLGVQGGMPGNIETLAYLLPKIPPGSTWSITGIGKSHLPMMLAGLSAGCDGLRVGLEDNIFLEKDRLAKNVELVKRAVEISKIAGRDIANAAETRELLGLTKQW